MLQISQLSRLELKFIRDPLQISLPIFLNELNSMLLKWSQF